MLKRYGLALVLAALVLVISGVLSLEEGTAIYQLPIAAVVLSAWYGGRGPGLFASLLCGTGILYWFVPPSGSFELLPDHQVAFCIFLALCVLLSELSAGRHRAEQALRGSEQRFRALVQFSFDVYWETDAQHRLTRQEVSTSLANAPAGAADIGKTPWEIPYVEPDEATWRRHQATLEAHLPFRDFEIGRPGAGGATHYIAISGLPTFDAIGRFVGYRGIGRDITERKSADAEHRSHLNFLESIGRIDRDIQSTDDLERMMGDVLDTVLDVFACDRAWLLYPCDPDAPSWRAVMERTRPGFPHGSDPGRQFPMTASDAEAARVALNAAAALAEGPGHERGVARELAEQFGVRSQMVLALHPKHDRPYLFGLHECSRLRSWDEDEQRLFEQIGRRLTDALSRSIAFGRLRESERRSEAAQRLARVGWWERDYVSGEVSLSDEASRIFGVQPVDLPRWQQRWVSLIHPEDRDRAAAASEAALTGRARYDIEYRVVRADGAVRVVHSQGDVVCDESGRPIRQFGVMQDVTELRRAEHELRASEARFRTFVDQATDAFFLMDQELRVVDVNRQACESMDWSREELIGMHPRDLDAGLEEGSIIDLAQRARAGGTVTFETRHRRRDGTVFPVEIRTGTFEQGGKLFYLALARDITERKRAEEALRATEARFRTLVESAADGFMLHAEDGTVIDVNHQACENLGYSREELIGMKLGDFDADLDDQALQCVFERVSKGDIVTIETHHRRKDGALAPVELRLRQVIQGGRRLTISLARNITERKRVEEERERSRRLEAELARVSRVTMLGELTTSIAHEVSQPLGGMITSAGACARWLAAEPPAIAEAQAALNNIIADGKRARDVIARIRALTKRQAPRMDRLDVNHKITEVLALTRHELYKQDIALRTRLGTALPPVAGDRVQLQQVLLNLIMNAIDAMNVVHDRSRELEIVSRNDESRTVLVEVRDNGVGLEPQRLEQVFEAFHTTKAEGLGIGLSLSRSIIEAHGGRLWASTNAPHGAVFSIALPAAEDVIT